jgi:hypothetical protein
VGVKGKNKMKNREELGQKWHGRSKKMTCHKREKILFSEKVGGGGE